MVPDSPGYSETSSSERAESARGGRGARRRGELGGPLHKQYPDQDEAVADWFKRKGWSVTARHWDSSREVLACRAEAARPEITLRITLSVIQDVPAHRIPTVLDGLHVNGAIPG